MKIKKQRLDNLLRDQNPSWSRAYIQEVIRQGLVKVNGIVQKKASYQVAEESIVDAEIKEPKFVSRAGFKLDQALNEFKKDFGLTVVDSVAIDSGLSTGGFTDCLLQHGAKHVYGVEVGTAQVHKKISEDSRVTVMEQTDLRDVKLKELVDVVTLDLSFISLLKVMEEVAQLMREGGALIVLIKPQFEVGKDHVGSNGIVFDDDVRNAAVQEVIVGIQSFGFEFKKLMDSPVTGKGGNKEHLAYYVRSK